MIVDYEKVREAMRLLKTLNLNEDERKEVINAKTKGWTKRS